MSSLKVISKQKFPMKCEFKVQLALLPNVSGDSYITLLDKIAVCDEFKQYKHLF